MTDAERRLRHSERMQRIFDTPPSFVVRWGVLIITIVLIIIGIAAYCLISWD